MVAVGIHSMDGSWYLYVVCLVAFCLRCSLTRLLFHDKAGASSDGDRKFKGLAWLFMGSFAGMAAD